MSYTDKVATFVGSLDTFYESVPAEDLELLVGPVLERMRSQPSSPLSGSPLGKYLQISILYTLSLLLTHLISYRATKIFLIRDKTGM